MRATMLASRPTARAIPGCRRFECPRSKYRFNHTCLPLFKKARGIPYHFKVYIDIPPFMEDRNKVNDSTLAEGFRHFLKAKFAEVKTISFWTSIIRQYVNGSRRGVSLDCYVMSFADDSPGKFETTLVAVMTKTWWWRSADNNTELAPVNEAFFMRGLDTEMVAENEITYLVNDLSVPKKFRVSNHSDKFIYIDALVRCQQIVTYERDEYEIRNEIKSIFIYRKVLKGIIFINYHQYDFIISKDGKAKACGNFIGSYRIPYPGSTFKIPLSRNSTLREHAVSWTGEFCGRNYVCNRNLRDQLPFCAKDQVTCEGCHCQNCEKYGDCCPDSELTSFTDSKKPRQKTTCEKYPYKYVNLPMREHILMISDCSDVESSTRDEERRQCLSRDNDIPRIDAVTGTVFRNEHCARCNNVENTSAWQYDISCVWHNKLRYFMFSNDPLADAKNENLCDVIMYHPNVEELRFCNTNDHIISTCNKSGELSIYDRKVEQLCSAYSHPITVLKGVKNMKYDNIFCALCNNVTFSSDFLSCPVILFKFPLSELLNRAAYTVTLKLIKPSERTQTFNNQSVYSSCEDGFVFDTINEKCRQMYCSKSRYVYRHSCLPLFKTGKGVPYNLTVHFSPPNATAMMYDTLPDQLGDHLSSALDGILGASAQPFWSFWRYDMETYTAIETNSLVGIAINIFYISNTISSNVTEIESALTRLQTEPWQLVSLAGEITVVTPVNKVFHTESFVNVSLISHGLHSPSVPFDRSMSDDNFIHVDRLLGCEKIAKYGQDEYTLDYVEKRAILDGYNLAENAFVVDEKGDLKTCTQYVPSYYKHKSTTPAAYERINLTSIENSTGTVATISTVSSTTSKMTNGVSTSTTLQQSTASIAVKNVWQYGWLCLQILATGINCFAF